MRVPEGGKQLDIIASPESGYTVSYLRAVVHHAKIYIRPMQKNLSLEPIKEPVSGDSIWYSGRLFYAPLFIIILCVQVYSEPPKEKCLTCGERVSVTSLREHIVVCKRG